MLKTYEAIERQIGSVEETIRYRAAGIREDLDRTIRGLDEGLHLNDLGEIQGRAGDLDRLVGIREALNELRNIARFEGQDRDNVEVTTREI